MRRGLAVAETEERAKVSGLWSVRTQDEELTTLEEVAELLDSEIDRQKLTVERTVSLLTRLELLGEECDRSPGIVDQLLQHTTSGFI